MEIIAERPIGANKPEINAVGYFSYHKDRAIPSEAIFLFQLGNTNCVYLFYMTQVLVHCCGNNLPASPLLITAG